MAFRSHWGFDSEFCNPSRGNEKGGVESEVGYFRRNYLTPVPEFSNWDELNEYLLSCRLKDATRHISGKEHAVGTAMELEREHLLPLTRPDRPEAEPAESGAPERVVRVVRFLRQAVKRAHHE